MVCVHIVFRTRVWQNNKKSMNRFSGMICNVSGDYNSPFVEQLAILTERVRLVRADSCQRAKELYIILHAYLIRADSYIPESAKVAKVKERKYSLVRGRKNSDEMRLKSQPYILQGMVCAHIVFRTRVWQNNKKSNNRYLQNDP
jgi:hypothetical protein